MKGLRHEFADSMKEIGQQDPRLVVMVGDISHGILQEYASACPGRYFNVGICEPTIVGMAAGLAMSGLIPVVHTIAPFIIERAYEQIKLDFGYQNLSVNLISVGSAFDYAQLGCSHHCYADLSLMSHFKRAKIFFPASPIEFNLLFKQSYSQDGINYFRLPEKTHEVELQPEQLSVGKGIRLRKGRQVTLIVIGPQLKNALAAADMVSAARGISVEVLYFPTIQPFDSELARESIRQTQRFITIEEASSHGGVYDRVLRAVQGIDGVRSTQIAISDFVHGYGSYDQLADGLGFSVQSIAQHLDRICNAEKQV